MDLDNTTFAEVSSSLRDFNVKTANLDEEQQFQPLILMNSYSNLFFGIEKSKAMVSTSLLFCANLFFPTVAAIISTFYLFGKMSFVWKIKSAFRYPNYGIGGQVKRTQIRKENNRIL